MIKVDIKNIYDNLDEYVGLKHTHHQSYAYFMHKHLFDNVNLKKENINLLNGVNDNLNAECDRYNALLNDNQIDLQRRFNLWSLMKFSVTLTTHS